MALDEVTDISRETLVDMFRKMLTIRHFEDKVNYLFLEGVLPGTIHQCQGQEAVAVGTCAALRKTDFISSTHRSHGHSLAKGMSVYSAMAELLGRRTGCCKGKGGSMHLADKASGIIPAIAVVGEGIVVATGLALAFKMQHSDQVAVSFFGDGAANTGAFHEGLNLAAIWKLPIIYVCENNLYAASTRFETVTAVNNIASRASSYNMPGVVTDGMDVLAVYQAVTEAVKRARNGEGPTLIECKTYRYVGHSRTDPAKYRSDEELEYWKSKDPIPRMRQLLISKGIITEAVALSIEQEVISEIDSAVAKAQNDPRPELQEALVDVYE